MATATARKTTRQRGASRASVKQSTVYEWVALDKRGHKMKGEMAGKNAALVKAELRSQGMNPQSVKEKSKPLFGSSGKRVTPKDIAIFSRQIATMMASGVPMMQAFEIIAGGQKNVRFKNMLVDVKQGIEGGSSLHESMGRYPVQFDELYRNLVKAGESAGVLDTVLDTVATYKERMEAMKAKIKKALFYPIMVLVVAALVTVIMLLFVVPVFKDVFENAGAQLPGPTQMVVAASEFMQSYWWIILLGVVGTIVGIVMAKKRSPRVCPFSGSRRAEDAGNGQHHPAVGHCPFCPHPGCDLPRWRAPGRGTGFGLGGYRKHCLRRCREADSRRRGGRPSAATGDAPDRPVPQHGGADDRHR